MSLCVPSDRLARPRAPKPQTAPPAHTYQIGIFSPIFLGHGSPTFIHDYKRLPEAVGCIAIPLRPTYSVGSADVSKPQILHSTHRTHRLIHTHGRPAGQPASHNASLNSSIVCRTGIHAADQQRAGRRRRIRWGGLLVLDVVSETPPVCRWWGSSISEPSVSQYRAPLSVQVRFSLHESSSGGTIAGVCMHCITIPFYRPIYHSVDK